MNTQEIPEKKRRIFDALTELVLTGRTPESITVSEIAEKAGIGKGTVYGYFTSKSEIFDGAVQYYVGARLDMLEELADKNSGSFRDAFCSVAQCVSEYADENGVLLGIMLKSTAKLSCSELCGRLKPELLLKRIAAFVDGIIELGLKDGTIAEKPDSNVLKYTAFTVTSYLLHGEQLRKSGICGESDISDAELCYRMCVRILNG